MASNLFRLLNTVYSLPMTEFELGISVIGGNYSTNYAEIKYADWSKLVM